MKMIRNEKLNRCCEEEQSHYISRSVTPNRSFPIHHRRRMVRNQSHIDNSDDEGWDSDDDRRDNTDQNISLFPRLQSTGSFLNGWGFLEGRLKILGFESSEYCPKRDIRRRW